MMVIRVQVPDALTEGVVAAARELRGVAAIALSRNASLEPEGDVVEIHAAREAVEQLLEAFEALGVQKVGSIALTSPDVVVGARVDAAEKEAPGDGADAVIWDELEQRTGSDSKLTWRFLVFLVAATNLAGIVLAAVVVLLVYRAITPRLPAGTATPVLTRAPRRGWHPAARRR